MLPRNFSASCYLEPYATGTGLAARRRDGFTQFERRTRGRVLLVDMMNFGHVYFEFGAQRRRGRADRLKKYGYSEAHIAVEHNRDLFSRRVECRDLSLIEATDPANQWLSITNHRINDLERRLRQAEIYDNVSGINKCVDILTALPDPGKAQALATPDSGRDGLAHATGPGDGYCNGLV